MRRTRRLWREQPNSLPKAKLPTSKHISLVDKYNDNPADTDTTKGDAAAAQYARENLSSDARSVPLTDDDGNITAYTLHDNWSIGGKSTVTMTTEIFKDSEENLYYVVHLAESVRHFFMPGWFDDMNAPVVSIALLTKNTDGTGDPPPPSPVNLIFDTNGGTFDDSSTTDSKSLTNPSAMEDGDVSSSLSSDKGTPTYANREFKGWSTNPNPSEGDIIKIYLDGAQLTKTELAKLFGDKTTVTLYAVWEDVKPHNNRTHALGANGICARQKYLRRRLVHFNPKIYDHAKIHSIQPCQRKIFGYKRYRKRRLKHQRP